ncbi:hypothetical protein B0H19DRAFT_1386777 [Mycena capillaripes]|nr:hypothetical protein B0H19DRAFT_1386777 [Mycena capillaripes]
MPRTHCRRTPQAEGPNATHPRHRSRGNHDMARASARHIVRRRLSGRRENKDTVAPSKPILDGVLGQRTEGTRTYTLHAPTAHPTGTYPIPPRISGRTPRTDVAICMHARIPPTPLRSTPPASPSKLASLAACRCTEGMVLLLHKHQLRARTVRPKRAQFAGHRETSAALLFSISLVCGESAKMGR